MRVLDGFQARKMFFRIEVFGKPALQAFLHGHAQSGYPALLFFQ